VLRLLHFHKSCEQELAPKDIDTRLGFLGQFARGFAGRNCARQVGGTYGRFSRPGTCFARATPFSQLISPLRNYLAEASERPLECGVLDWNWLTATVTGKDSEQSNAGQRKSDHAYSISGRRAIAGRRAKARNRDAQFDLDHLPASRASAAPHWAHLVSLET